jgi:hypothetical protein
MLAVLAHSQPIRLLDLFLRATQMPTTLARILTTSICRSSSLLLDGLIHPVCLIRSIQHLRQLLAA